MGNNGNTLPTKGTAKTGNGLNKINNSDNAQTIGSNTLLVGMLIGGMAGMALGALVTMVARLIISLAGSVVRRLLQRGKDSEGVDFRWLLQ